MYPLSWGRMMEYWTAGVQTSRQFLSGIAVTEITDSVRRKLELSGEPGQLIVQAVEKASRADAVGFKPGDIVRRINRTRIEKLTDFQNFLRDTSCKRLVFSLLRNGDEVILGLIR